ncbi:hypothetical protein RSJ68_08855 [Neisseria sp. DTU_2020_1000833_1_SI_GRL_NUU_006]|jgi:hypothetical protein|uniref:hypothetical protein n=1 Tax=Neisseria sicca TaxID=490 RepID=UPI0005D31D46|nr:hypothetical protein [Neisseria sicca]KJJ16697.1 hypothetical protein HMPREF3156_01424 [Neisseria sp. HMSC06F02]OFN32517.1 hypothetical protein HMPREF2568_06200 [Neisseria sp. HMSC059F02]OFS03757.1 hypothetical protein HMPREF2954_03020 [Neisseria sp. HMSC067H09]WNU96549.1 hypothetical protein RSJ68_08855 [Neisseria sp. DTU_2020_1000833_1_SI_GRL_NUU_006]
MTNMTKDEIKALQIKAAEISDHFEKRSAVYVRSGQEIYEANRENHDDAFVTSCIANDYWWKFEWYLKGSDLWKDSDFDDIDEIAAEFEGWFAGFCQKKSAN